MLDEAEVQASDLTENSSEGREPHVAPVTYTYTHIVGEQTSTATRPLEFNGSCSLMYNTTTSIKLLSNVWGETLGKSV